MFHVSRRKSGQVGGRWRRWNGRRATEWTLEPRVVLASLGYTPAQIVNAYGYDKVVFDAGGISVPGDGRGETVALFEVGATPALVGDLAVFDQAFNLPDLTWWSAGSRQPTTPYLKTVGFDGGDQIVAQPSDQAEAILDVEWLHAVAPAANILIVDAPQTSDLPAANAFAARQPGVVVISNSYSDFDYHEAQQELGDDASFTTPAGRPGVTFVDSSGDTGAPSHPPDFSPNVLSVGGTSLTLNAAGNYGSETGWAGSGGGFSLYEPIPSYQRAVLPRGARRRAVPDVAILGNKKTGVQVYNTDAGGWTLGGGTSLAAPLWAGIIAIADEGRRLRGLSSLDGPTQTLPDLYRLPRRDFHTITIGNNGFQAHPGYNLVTGLGSPYVNRVVSGLVHQTAVFRAPQPGKPLRPPASYFNTSPTVLEGTAGSAFNGILATLRLKIPASEAQATTTTVDWGDATALNSVPLELNPIGSHIFQLRSVAGSAGRKTFSSPGTYRIVATLTFPSGSSRAVVRTIHVAAAPLTIAVQPLATRAGAVFAGAIATFTDSGATPELGDPNAAAPYSATVKWGDGTTSPGTVAVRTTAPGFAIYDRHAYRTPGSYPVAVAIHEHVPDRTRPILYLEHTRMRVFAN